MSLRYICDRCNTDNHYKGEFNVTLGETSHFPLVATAKNEFMHLCPVCIKQLLADWLTSKQASIFSEYFSDGKKP